MGKLGQAYSRILTLAPRLTEVARRAARSPRLRGEILWVVAHKVLEFGFLFATLKVFTTLLGKKVYGEFMLVMSGLAVLTTVLMMPVQQAYLRYMHSIKAAESGRSTGTSVLRWFAIATLGVAVCACFLTTSFSRWFGLETLTVLAAGLLFAGNRWRYLGTQVLDFQRNRRACAIQNLGFLTAKIVAVIVVIKIWFPSASVALFAVAGAAAVFGLISLTGLLRDVRRQPKGPPSELMKIVRSYGIAAGALLFFQWMQNLGDRYILAILLDKEAVGLYSAGYQACGIPYLAAFSILYFLLVPIAFQRAKDVAQPRQIWSADKVILGGVGVYLVLGAIALPVYAVFGQRILLFLTTKDFVLPSRTLMFLALSRYVQYLALLAHIFFNTHKRMGTAFGYRALGAAIALPISWFAISWYGITGAVVGGCIASSIYLVLICLGPRGCVSLVMRARRQLHEGISETQ